MTDKRSIENLRVPTSEHPLRILVSACLAGTNCGFDGNSYGDYPGILKLMTLDTVSVTRFCPEDFSFGTPREMCDIHGGTGLDVLNGIARVLTESGKDWTDGMIRASEKMLGIAQKEKIELAILMDISAACGSQVIYDGNRFSDDKRYQIGAGVCAAQLIKNGFPVISQRDFASLELLYARIDPSHQIDPERIDHHETDWYKNYFNV